MTSSPCPGCLELALDDDRTSLPHRDDPACRDQLAVHRALESNLAATPVPVGHAYSAVVAALGRRKGLGLAAWLHRQSPLLTAYWLAATAGSVWILTSVPWTALEVPAALWVPPLMIAAAALATVRTSPCERWLVPRATETGGSSS